MGCHTWFYRKLPIQPDYNTCKAQLLHKYNENLVLYKRYLEGKNLDKQDKELIKFYPDYYGNKDWLTNSIQVLERLIRIVDKNLCKEAVMKRYRIDVPSTRYTLTFYHNGTFYVDFDENYNSINHDVFRVSNYPDTVLHSYEEYLEFVNNPLNGAYLQCKEDTWNKANKKMKEFWDKYPDGIVKFG